MAVEVLLQRKGDALVAAESISADTIASLGMKEVIRATLRRPRNYKHLQRYMVLMHEIFINQNIYASEYKMRKALEMAAGHHDTMRALNGEEILIPSSVDFASLPQESFDEVYNAVCRLVVKDILPGVTDENLKQRINDLIGEPA